MGTLSDTTMGKIGIETKITPFDTTKEVFAKAFSEVFYIEKYDFDGEFLKIKEKDISLVDKKIEIQLQEKEILKTKYDPNKYLGDSRANQCNPSEHLIRNMSPLELKKYLFGQTIEQIAGIRQNVLDSDGKHTFCFSPETFVNKIWKQQKNKGLFPFIFH